MISGMPEGHDSINPIAIHKNRTPADVNQMTSPSTKAPSPSEGLGARVTLINPEHVGEAFGLKGLNPYHILGLLREI